MPAALAQREAAEGWGPWMPGCQLPPQEGPAPRSPPSHRLPAHLGLEQQALETSPKARLVLLVEVMGSEGGLHTSVMPLLFFWDLHSTWFTAGTH